MTHSCGAVHIYIYLILQYTHGTYVQHFEIDYSAYGVKIESPHVYTLGANLSVYIGVLYAHCDMEYVL